MDASEVATILPVVAQLRDLSCPVCKISQFKTIKLYRKHIKEAHELQYCDLCLDTRRAFLSEHILYTAKDLARHVDRGDIVPDAQGGKIKGHPLCEFCNTRYYGDDELFLHMRERHYTCHLCEKSIERRFDYYETYADLEAHFRDSHFLCEEDYCLERKFIVFSNEIDLAAHRRSAHMQQMSQRERSRNSRIDIFSSSSISAAAPSSSTADLQDRARRVGFLF